LNAVTGFCHAFGSFCLSSSSTHSSSLLHISSAQAPEPSMSFAASWLIIGT
jgi:hypothetical protein